jgi:hypothetical protein
VPKLSKRNSRSGRDRAAGWTHAKRSGHRHESDIASRLRSDLSFADALSVRCFNEKLGLPANVGGGGASAKHVEDVFGARTNGKPDLYVEWSEHRTAKISLKKSTGGQVFLTSVERFVTGFEKQFGVNVPTSVKTGLDLFIGGNEPQLKRVMTGKRFCGPIHRRTEMSQEEHQTRLLGLTLERYFPSEWTATLDWFTANIGDIVDFVFARGHAKKAADFATHVWYLEPRQSPQFDLVLPITRIKVEATKRRAEICVGRRGSTIQLPFGFLQMHAPKSANFMQFHHSFKKLNGLAASTKE